LGVQHADGDRDRGLIRNARARSVCAGLPREAPPIQLPAMPNPALLECFPAPTDTPFVIEHVAEEFTSVCPKTGHPDFGAVTLRYAPRPASAGGLCVELKSLKLYYQSFRNEGIYYEAVTNTIRDHLAAAMKPAWMQVVTDWKGRGGIRSTIRAEFGAVPQPWQGR